MSDQEPSQTEKETFMRRAFEVAAIGMNGGFGGPFGAVIAKDGVIVGEGHNQVVADHDPTAHAEVTAIRNAGKQLHNFDLSGCRIYVNALPCPMCMTAILWARIDKLYYGAFPEDAAAIGFDDAYFYEEIRKDTAARALPTERIESLYDEAKASLDAWLTKSDRTHY